MEKLKTLKDLEKLCKCKVHCDCYEPDPETLRKAAKEWIKEIKEKGCKHEALQTEEWEMSCGSCCESQGCEIKRGEWLVTWIEHFFNLEQK